MRYLFLLTLMSLLFACNNLQETKPENNEPQTKLEDEESKHPEPAANEQNWDGFWTQFQKAVLAGNKEEVKHLTHFGGITEQEMNDRYDDFFGGDYTAYFEKATAADAKSDESTFDGVEASDIMRFEIYESGEDEEGNEYESGVSYYFGKIDGVYRLVYIVAAG